MNSDHHQRADGHVVAVGTAAAIQASRGTVAAVVTTAVTVWSLVLVVLEVRGDRRGGAVLRAQDDPAGRRVEEPGAGGEAAAPPVRRTRAAPRKQAGSAVASRSGPWALTAWASQPWASVATGARLKAASGEAAAP